MTGIQDIFQSDYPLKEVEDHFYDRGLKKTEGDYSGFVLQLALASVCDGCEHFIIPPAMWKATGEESVKDGEYKYWHSANWRRPTIWSSVRDSIVDHVEYIETMIENHWREDGDSE